MWHRESLLAYEEHLTIHAIYRAAVENNPRVTHAQIKLIIWAERTVNELLIRYGPESRDLIS